MTDPLFDEPAVRRRMIDVTPGAGWRRTARALAAASALVIVLVIVLPLLWLLGGVLALGLLGATAVMLGWSFVRQWRRPRRGVGPGDDTVDVR